MTERVFAVWHVYTYCTVVAIQWSACDCCQDAYECNWRTARIESSVRTYKCTAMTSLWVLIPREQYSIVSTNQSTRIDLNHKTSTWCGVNPHQRMIVQVDARIDSNPNYTQIIIAMSPFHWDKNHLWDGKLRGRYDVAQTWRFEWKTKLWRQQDKFLQVTLTFYQLLQTILVLWDVYLLLKPHLSYTTILNRKCLILVVFLMKSQLLWS